LRGGSNSSVVPRGQLEVTGLLHQRVAVRAAQRRGSTATSDRLLHN